MYEVEKKSHYLGQILVIVILQVIMLLFRLVEPIHCENLFPGQYTHFMNEFVYFAIEFILVIYIVAHGSYHIPFKELGLSNIKENLASLVVNVCYLVGATVVTYLMSQFSRRVEFDAISLSIQFVINFIVIAFLKEVIFRGFLFKACYGLFNGKGIIASLMTAMLFALTYVPSILMALDQVTMMGVIHKLTIPFALGLYLDLIYYYGRNLWLCTIIHGVIISFGYLNQDFILMSIECLYIAILLVYLIYKMVKYYQGETAEKDENEPLDSEQESISDSEIEQEVVKKEIIEEPKKSEQESNKEYGINKAYETKPIETDPKENRVVDKVNEEKLSAPKLESEKIPDLFSVLNQDMDAEDDEDVHTVNWMEKEPKIEAEPNYIEHLEKQLGEFEAIYKQVIPTEPPIDILYFKGKTNDALVTNGMRRMPMNTPPELKAYQNIELMMYVDKAFDLSDEGLMREENAWLVKLLSDMAVYPSLNNSYLGWGHIVGNGENLEAYDKDVKYCGALVYPPINLSDVHFYQYSENNLNVFIYNVMPLYKEELMFIQEQSSDQFINLMAAMGIDQTITRNRVNIIRQLKHQGHNR